MGTWYRVEDGRYAPTLDEFERPMGNGRPFLTVREFTVHKETPCGVWLDDGYGNQRHVLYQSRKRFACPTLEEAWESWRARKRKHLRLLEAQVRHVHEALALAAER
jgi:hypothetical protein